MTDISNPRPQVNAAMFKNYVGRRVTTVIKVSRNEGGMLVGDAPDGIQITVRQVPPHAATSSVFVEVIGVVENDHSLRAEVCTSFGDNFDMTIYNKLCQLSNTENRDCFVIFELQKFVLGSSYSSWPGWREHRAASVGVICCDPHSGGNVFQHFRSLDTYCQQAVPFLGEYLGQPQGRRLSLLEFDEFLEVARSRNAVRCVYVDAGHDLWPYT